VSESIPAVAAVSGSFSLLDWIGGKVGPDDAGKRYRGAFVLVGLFLLLVWFGVRAKK
jgi:hypothetical protein